MSTIFRRLRHVFGRSRHDADLLEEIEAHRALRQEALEREGLAAEDAAHASRRALGIGANSALFSIFNSLILRPLPVRDPGRLALLTNGSWSYPVWEQIRARETELFDGAFAWSPQAFNRAASGQSDPVDGAYVSGRLFDVLGVTAVRGRMISPADDSVAAPGRTRRRHQSSVVAATIRRRQ